MKTLYSRLSRWLFAAALFFTLQQSAKSQILSVGDIAFTGYNSMATNVDSFSFVLLVNIPAGTQISFTDNAWLANNQFRVGEQHLTWTAGQAFLAGREITIFGTTSPSPLTPNSIVAYTSNSAGTCAGSMVSLSTSGDQIIAYQGTVASPTIISAFHMNVYAVSGVGDCGNTTTATWDPLCVDGGTGTVGNTNWSTKPPTLTNGTNAVWMGTFDVTASEEDWAVFNCTGPLATPAQVRAAVNNNANWVSGDGPAAPFRRVNPSRCTFLGLIPLPITLLNFTGKLNTNKTASLQWKVEEQQDLQNFVLEESRDGVSFTALSIVNPGASNEYTLLDHHLYSGKNYYRLKMVELNGKVYYSKVISIDLQDGIVVSLYPNPVTELLTIQYFGAVPGRKAVLSDITGKVLLQLKLAGGEQTIDMQKMAAGIYLLKLEDGSTYKIFKE